MWADGRMRLFRVDAGVSETMTEHHDWLAHAGTLLGLPETIAPAPDYINTFIGWRVDTARALLDHIERTTGRNWFVRSFPRAPFPNARSMAFRR